MLGPAGGMAASAPPPARRRSAPLLLLMLALALLLLSRGAEAAEQQACSAGFAADSLFSVTYLFAERTVFPDKVTKALRFTWKVNQGTDEDDCAQPGSACCGDAEGAAAQSLDVALEPRCLQGPDGAAVSPGVFISAVPPQQVPLLKLWLLWTVNAQTGVISIYGIQSAGQGAAPYISIVLPKDSPCVGEGAVPGWPCPDGGCRYTLRVGTREDDSVDGGGGDGGCCALQGAAQRDVTTWKPVVTAGTKRAWRDTPNLSNAPVRFLVVGDWGAKLLPDEARSKDLAVQRVVSKAMQDVAAARAPQFVVNTGDNAYESGLGSRAMMEQFRQNWRDVYQVGPLAGLTWYSVAGNHDHFRYEKSWQRNQTDQFPANCVFKTDDLDWCLNKAPCCFTQAWQYTSTVADPQWRLEPGTWSFSPDPLVELFMLDTNPYIDSYLESSSHEPDIPDGLRKWRALLHNETEPTLLRNIENSKAKWRIVVGHHVLANGNNGYHCKGPQGLFDCLNLRDLRKKLMELKVPLYLCGHDHSVQATRLRDDRAKREINVVTSGAGCKRDIIFPVYFNTTEVFPNKERRFVYPTKKITWEDQLFGELPYGFVFVAVTKQSITYEVYEVTDKEIRLAKSYTFDGKYRKIHN